MIKYASWTANFFYVASSLKKHNQVIYIQTKYNYEGGYNLKV